MVTVTPSTVALPLLVAELDPAHKTADISLILGAAALVMAVSAPIWGALSDATHSAFGRRLPFFVGGYLGGILASALIPFSDRIGLVAVLWCIAYGLFLAANTALYAAMADFVPKKLLGRTSAGLSVSSAVAPIGGLYAVQWAGLDRMWMFVLPILASLLLTPWLVIVLRSVDQSDRRPAMRIWEAFRGRVWTLSGKAPEFGLVLLSRLLVHSGFAVYLTYRSFNLTDHINQPLSKVPQLMFLASVASAICVVVSSPLVGYLSDRLNKRKSPVLMGAGLLAGGLLMLSLSNTVPWFMAGVSLVGAGLAIYTSMGTALAVAVVPRASDIGKSMGALTMTSALAHSIVPAISPVFLAPGDNDNYPLLFALGAVVTMVGALCICPIKSVS